MFLSEYVGFPRHYNFIYSPYISFTYHRRYLTLVTDLSQASGKSGIRLHFTPKVSVLASQLLIHRGTAVAQWLRCCATNRKIAGSIPDGVIGIFH